MQKIPTLFARDFTQPRNPITPRYDERCEWVTKVPFTARRKFDGTAILIQGDQVFKRFSIKASNYGKPKGEDLGFILADIDVKTDKAWGWIPAKESLPEDKWIFEAMLCDDATPADYNDGTYELCGPKINGNPEKFDRHVFIRHDCAPVLIGAPTTFPEVLNYLSNNNIEGIVFYEDGGDRRAKVKQSDFGLKRHETLPSLF